MKLNCLKNIKIKIKHNVFRLLFLAITPLLLLLLFFLANVLPFDHAFLSSVAGVYAIGHVLVWEDDQGISLGRSLWDLREARGSLAVFVHVGFGVLVVWVFVGARVFGGLAVLFRFILYLRE